MRCMDVNGLLNRAAERVPRDEVAGDENREIWSAIGVQGVLALL
jgi:hypothetical protein